MLPDDVDEVFEAASASFAPGDGARYLPKLWATAQLHFKRRGTNVDEWREVSVLAEIPERAKRLDWEGADVHPESAVRWQREPPVAAEFAKLAAVARRGASYRAAKKRLATYLYQSQRVESYRCEQVDLRSEAGEQLSEFRQRVNVALAERRDLELGKLREKYADQIDRLDGKVRTAEARIDRERSQLRDRKLQTAVSFGTSVLGALLGRKKVSVTNVGRATRAVRDVGRSRKEADDVDRAEEGLEELLEQRKELEREMEHELESLRVASPSAAEVGIEVIEVGPLKTDLVVDRLGLLWSLERAL